MHERIQAYIERKEQKHRVHRIIGIGIRELCDKETQINIQTMLIGSGDKQSLMMQTEVLERDDA